jgi:hypothetical protein
VIDEADSDGMVIKMEASVMEFVFQGEFCIAEDGLGQSGHRLPRKMLPLLVKNDARI